MYIYHYIVKNFNSICYFFFIFVVFYIPIFKLTSKSLYNISIYDRLLYIYIYKKQYKKIKISLC
jgi:hypothetical protein